MKGKGRSELCVKSCDVRQDVRDRNTPHPKGGGCPNSQNEVKVDNQTDFCRFRTKKKHVPCIRTSILTLLIQKGKPPKKVVFPG